jgi:hypothetical protein
MRRGEVHTEVWCENLREANTWKSLYWIDLAQDRDKWQGLVNAVMNLRVP